MEAAARAGGGRGDRYSGSGRSRGLSGRRPAVCRRRGGDADDRVGEIRHVELADGSRLTLDTATKVDVEIGRSGRGAHLRYGRARFQIAPDNAPFVVETGGSTITARSGIIDVEAVDGQDRIQVLAGAAEVRGPAQAQAEPVTLGAGKSARSGLATRSRRMLRRQYPTGRGHAPVRRDPASPRCRARQPLF